MGKNKEGKLVKQNIRWQETGKTIAGKLKKYSFKIN
jgi:hypothetical protein